MERIFIYSDSGALATGVSEILAQEVRLDSVWCVASGASPAASYHRFAAQNTKDVSKLRIVLLDEWMGLEPNSKNSCKHFIHSTMLNPLGITDKNFLS
ncbi:MAG: hypothetical protein AAF975_09020, partial [Spirochaetota bacterium]